VTDQVLLTPVTVGELIITTPVAVSDLVVGDAPVNAIFGVPGPIGSSWYTGSTTPGSGLGLQKDFYLRTTNGDYYEKTGVSTWTFRGNLKGPQVISTDANNQAILGTDSYIYVPHDSTKSDTTHLHTGVYDPIGTAAAAVSAHISSADPHADRSWATGQFVPLSSLDQINGTAVLDSGRKIAIARLPQGANGVAVLDGSGLIPTGNLPPLAINEITVVATEAAMLALTAQRGDVAVRSDTGKTYILSADTPTVLNAWKEILAAGQVTAVNGQSGVVSLGVSDITGLVSALSGKSDTTHAHSGVYEANGAVATHAAVTTSVHGISNTANLVYTSDSRLTNSRTPTTHASTHAVAGSDPITIAESQVTNLTADLAAKVGTSDSRLTDTRIPTDASVTDAKISTTLSPSKITGTAVVTGDSRLTDNRTPLDASVTDVKIASTLSPSKITGTAVVTADSRLTDARTPTTHAASHASGGTDAITISESQVTNLVTDLSGKAATSHSHTQFIPAGGTTGQVLSKINGTDYNSQWVNQSIGTPNPLLDTYLFSTNTTIDNPGSGFFRLNNATGSSVTQMAFADISNSTSNNYEYFSRVKTGDTVMYTPAATPTGSKWWRASVNKTTRVPITNSVLSQRTTLAEVYADGAGSNVSATTASIAYLAGDLILVDVYSYGEIGLVNNTPTMTGATFTLIQTKLRSDGYTRVSSYYAYIASALSSRAITVSCSVTAGSTFSGVSASVAVVTGADPSNPIGAKVTGFATTAVTNTTAITTTFNNSYIYLAGNIINSPNSTNLVPTSSTQTLRATSYSIGSLYGYRLVTTSGTSTTTNITGTDTPEGGGGIYSVYEVVPYTMIPVAYWTFDVSNVTVGAGGLPSASDVCNINIIPSAPSTSAAMAIVLGG